MNENENMQGQNNNSSFQPQDPFQNGSSTDTFHQTNISFDQSSFDQSSSNNSFDQNSFDQNGSFNSFDQNSFDQNGSFNSFDQNSFDQNGSFNSFDQNSFDQNGSFNSFDQNSFDQNGSFNSFDQNSFDQSSSNNGFDQSSFNSQPTNTYDQNGYNTGFNQQNAYNTNQAMPSYQQTPTNDTNLPIVSLILSIVSLFCCGPLLSIPALICGILGMKKKPEDKCSLAGVIIAGISLALWILSIIFFIGISIRSANTLQEEIHNEINSLDEYDDDFNDYYDSYSNDDDLDYDYN